MCIEQQCRTRVHGYGALALYTAHTNRFATHTDLTPIVPTDTRVRPSRISLVRYDSGSDGSENEQDRDFIDDAGDDKKLVDSYSGKQVFNDEKPQWEESEKERPEDVEQDELEKALSKVKSKRKKAKIDPRMMEQACESLIGRMANATRDDKEARKRKQPGTKKLQMLDELCDLLGKSSWQGPLLDADVLGALRDWLHPSSEGTLPNNTLRTRLYSVLEKLPGMCACEVHGQCVVALQQTVLLDGVA